MEGKLFVMGLFLRKSMFLVCMKNENRICTACSI
jgi:hypothetical protein